MRAPLTDRWVLSLTIALVVLAGCSNPLPQGGPTNSTVETSVQSSPPTADLSPTVTPTPTLDERLPAGISSAGLENASALLAAHVEGVTATGYVIYGTGSTTVQRRGILVDVTSRQRNRVTSNASAYTTRRTLAAGIFGREHASWGNRTVEYGRTQANGEVTYSRGTPKSSEELAGARLLRPYLEGGNYTLADSVQAADGTRYTLSASGIANRRSLLMALPDDAERVTSYESTVVISDSGRIRSLRATIGYVIAGRDANQRLEFTLERAGNVSVESPPWVETAKRRADGE